MQFLRGLNDQFNTVKFNVLMMDPLPNIAKVFSYAIQQERQINSNELTGSMSLINAAGNNSSNYRPSCTYCGKDNHTMVHLIIILQKGERELKAIPAKETLEQKETRSAHTVVFLTIL